MLRRLIRRAVRSMRLLGVDEGDHAYPLLTASKDAMKALLSWRRTGGRFPRLPTRRKARSATLSAGTTIWTLRLRAQRESRSAPLFLVPRVLLYTAPRVPLDLTLEMAANRACPLTKGLHASWPAEGACTRRRPRSKARHTDVRVFHDIRRWAAVRRS